MLSKRLKLTLICTVIALLGTEIFFFEAVPDQALFKRKEAIWIGGSVVTVTTAAVVFLLVFSVRRVEGM